MGEYVSLKEAMKHSNIYTKLSLLIFGFGNFIHGQIVRGLLFFILEVAYIVYMASFGVQSLINFTTLGTKTQQ